VTGLSSSTARRLGAEAHLAQSVADILTTPIGSRVMRRDYGSLLPELIDQPANGGTRVRLYGATAIALMRWEPRLRLSRIQLSATAEPGTYLLDLEGQRTDVPRPSERTRLTIPLRVRAA